MAQPAPQKGTLPVLQYCTPAQLAVDPTYQRDLDARSHQLIARIANGWDWNLCPPLVVAQRHDRTLWVVDGQHRLEAARMRGDIGQLPCVVFHPADPADEARTFVQLNDQRRPLTPYALYNASLAAGDEAAIALDTLMRQVGLRFSGQRNVELLKPGQINIGKIRSWHGHHGDAATHTALTALARVVRTQGPRGTGVMFPAIGAVVLDRGAALIGHLFGEVLDRPADEWLTDFHARAATDGIGLQAAAIAVVGDAYAEALREIEDDDAPPPAPAPEPPRGPEKIDLNAAPSSMEHRAGQWSGRE